MGNNKNLHGHLFALTANVMWGLMSPIGKSALQEFSAISVTTFRMVGAAAAFWILSIFCKQEHVDHRDMLKIFFASLFALVFNQGIFIFGLSMTSPIDASIVTTTLPIVTMIVAAIYLKEPITNKKVLGIFVGAMGALILIMSSQAASSGNGSLIGDLLCLVAQISFSIYLTVFKGLSQRYSAVTINKWMFIYASMCYIPFSYQDISVIQWTSIPMVAILQVLYVVLGKSVWNQNQEKGPAFGSPIQLIKKIFFKLLCHPSLYSEWQSQTLFFRQQSISSVSLQENTVCNSARQL